MNPTKLNFKSNGNPSGIWAYLAHNGQQLNQVLAMTGKPADIVSCRLGYFCGEPVMLVQGKKPGYDGELSTGHISGFRSLVSIEVNAAELTYDGPNSLKCHPLNAVLIAGLAEFATKNNEPVIKFAPLHGTENNPTVSRKASWNRNAGTVTNIRKIRGNNGKVARAARQVGNSTIALVGSRTLIVASSHDQATAGNVKLPVLWKAAEGSRIMAPLPKIAKDGTFMVNVTDQEGTTELFQLNVSHLMGRTNPNPQEVTVEPRAKASLPQGMQFICDVQGGKGAVFARMPENLGDPMSIRFAPTPRFQPTAS